MYNGSCLSQSRMPSLVGGVPLLGRKERRHGKLLLCAYFGRYGRRETEGPLKILIWWAVLFYDPFCTCSWSGLGCNLGIPHCLDLTSLIGWVVSEVRELFFVYPSLFWTCTHCVYFWALWIQIICFYLSKEKKVIYSPIHPYNPEKPYIRIKDEICLSVISQEYQLGEGNAIEPGFPW